MNEWVELGQNKDGTHNICCGVCGVGKFKSKGHARSYYTRHKFKYCPNCGARMADRKTEPQICETCKWGEWYRKGYDITMMSDECGGCCSWNNKWKPKDEPQKKGE